MQVRSTVGFSSSTGASRRKDWHLESRQLRILPSISEAVPRPFLTVSPFPCPIPFSDR